MSMNKTCPISNFTSEEDPDSIKDLFLSRTLAFNGRDVFSGRSHSIAVECPQTNHRCFSCLRGSDVLVSIFLRVQGEDDLTTHSASHLCIGRSLSQSVCLPKSRRESGA